MPVLPPTNPLNDSLLETMKEINRMRQTLTTFVQNNTLGNALKTLNIARTRLLQAKDQASNLINGSITYNDTSMNVNLTLLQAGPNETIEFMVQTLNRLSNYILKQRDVRNCTVNITQGLFELMFNFTTNMTSCPVNEANKGLKIINDAAEYINFMVNLTTVVPVLIDNCMTRSDSRPCLIDIIAAYSKIIAEAPGKISMMLIKAKLYPDFFLIFVSICFVDVTFASQVQITNFGIDVTACFAKNLIA